MEGTPKVAVSLTDFYFPADTRTGQPYNDVKQVGLKATNPSATGFDVLVNCELSASLTKLKFNWFATTRTNVGLVYFEKLAVDLDATWTTDTVTDVLTFDVPLDHLTLSNLYRKSVMISGFKMDYPAADANNQAYLAVQFEAKNTTSLTTVTLDLSKDTTT